MPIPVVLLAIVESVRELASYPDGCGLESWMSQTYLLTKSIHIPAEPAISALLREGKDWFA